ncbi:hypothetical protein LOD99_13786 [Oopsacas minuta]|nr:hypothetical protein LOD99_13786 [Oopsacas minuta]
MTSGNPTVDWSTILAQEEVQLLPALSFGLVELGYTGTHYPILQKLFQFSAKIYPHLSQPVEPVFTSNNVATLSQFSFCNSDSECKDSKTPDEDESCLGMCGPDCKCWCWVCGDCCIHQGCYEHDQCCRGNILSYNCWFPFNFSCNSYSKQC